jgi:putative protease
MKKFNKKPELLSPAGNFQKLEFALKYGADAVYIGARDFSLRYGAPNFSIDDLQSAVSFAHSLKKKVYLTLNILFHNEHIEKLKTFLKKTAHIPVDAYIMSDLGAICYVRENYPDKRIHISTQASVTNYETIQAYEKIGASRIILARELSLDEIKAIRDKTSIELETFVHGAMCIAYSGRCLLSNYFTNSSVYKQGEKKGNMKKAETREANLGDCAQSCRWQYHLVESTRPGELLPVIEENGATTILSSKDLNLSAHIDKLIDAGIDSFKIEGRMKSLYYVANTARVYRYAIDRAAAGEKADKNFLRELDKVSHREYTTGFYFSHNRAEATLTLSPTGDSGYIRDYRFLGYVIKPPNEVRLENDEAYMRASNQIRREWTLEAIKPDGKTVEIKEFRLFKNGKETELAQPNDEFVLKSKAGLDEYDIIRVKIR